LPNSLKCALYLLIVIAAEKEINFCLVHTQHKSHLLLHECENKRSEKKFNYGGIKVDGGRKERGKRKLKGKLLKRESQEAKISTAINNVSGRESWCNLKTN
jgi:hypothetical protein